MLLETALADFSSSSDGPRAIPVSWDAMPPKHLSPPQSECSGEASPTASSSPEPVTKKQQPQRELELSPSPTSSIIRRLVRQRSGELYAHPHRQHLGELLSTKILQRQYSGDLLPHSHSRVAGGSPPRPQHQQLGHFDSSWGSPHGGGRQVVSSSVDEEAQKERGSSSSSSHWRSQSDAGARNHRRNASSAAAYENFLHGIMPFEGGESVPFEWEQQQQVGRAKAFSGAEYRASSSSRGGAGTLNQNENVQLPPGRLVIMRKKIDEAECSNSTSPPNGPTSPDGRRQQKQRHGRKVHGRHSGAQSSSSSSGASTRTQQQQQLMHLKLYPGDVIRISRMSSTKQQHQQQHHTGQDSHCSVDLEVEKYFEDESPVSTLHRLPSPTGGHSNHDLHHVHESPADTSRRGSAVRPNSSASGSPIDTRISLDSSACSSSREGANAGGRALRCLPSFHSSSLHSSAPAASNSSSSNFMASCLVALEVALHSEPDEERERDEQDDAVDEDDDDESSDSKNDSSFEEPGGHVNPRDVRRFFRGHESPELHRCGSLGHHRWAGADSQLEPEYHTMDFYSENGDDRNYRLSSAAASSRSYSADRASTGGTSSDEESEVYRARDSHQQNQRHHHSNDPRSSLDEYSWGDRRFLQDHSRSWEEEQADEFGSENLSSGYNLSMGGRHQEVYWDDQQSADMNSERAEEVVRGAVDGLRFTYSPVSSAFVFTRPPNSSPFETGELPEDRVVCFSPPNTVDTEISQRFSISLDYATSICSEDSLPYSVGRSSDVTELGLSRAESWSRVRRGSSHAAAPQRYPSGLLDRRVGYEVVLEEEFYETPEHEHVNVDHSDQLVRKRTSKKSGFPACLPFRAILRNFKAFSPGRSRLGAECPQCELHKHQSPTNWAPPHQTAQTAVRSH